MFNHFLTIYLSGLILFAIISEKQGFKTDSTKCFVKLNDTIYHIRISKNFDFLEEESDTIHEWNSDGKTQKHDISRSSYSRLKRSTNGDGHSSVSDLEINRLKRKIGRLEKKLSESIDELSDEIRNGFRRMEDKMRAIETPSQSKRAVRYLPTNNPCPTDFLPVDVGKLQSCYLLSNFNTTWYEAKSYCTALGSHLVALGSIREHYVLTYMIKNHPEYSKAEGWWTSGIFVTKTKQWMWTLDTYKPFTFIRWAPNQPDDDTSNCVYLRRDTDQLWNDEICTFKFNFVCETCFRCDRHNGY